MASQLPIMITPEGHAAVCEEMRWLWRVERPRVTSEVEAAAALGDRSENAEYQYGKRRLREIDGRMRHLSKRLDRMRVMTAQHQAAAGDIVGFGAYVRVENEGGEQTIYRLVGPDEFDPDAGFISVESPVARALLGKEVGDVVEVQRPKGLAELEIIALRYGGPPPSQHESQH
ncbi:MAG: transcription elongation factor GreB [Nannocystaceae bacterium]|nr:transcription elongation factor GreB [Nannocystaceae bacterium]